MESTRQFVNKMNENAEKARHNKENNGKRTPSAKLPTKQHGNNP
ncbi:hypothetical protein E6C60_3996 [Paenibacillus algicola]|uniref:DUF4023 domain-containing protein n=1 Tax=Paenibacillus algicola TaxID=2565926 RepID=A0A4P8XS49_9BACL|nr:DUF4023 family protein [Paenibacillus algicola]QCT04701.1 hypothetical protein E6C60_3996 [Paenibacillus algicola]